jgi:RNA polymerase sigma factor (sigma-70 family)
MSVSDAQAFVTALVESHGGQLRRFLAARLRNTTDLSDIVQEVFLRMLRVPNVESIRSPEAYLFTVAQHVVQQHSLRQSAMPPSIELSRMLTSSPAASDDPVLDLDAMQCLESLQAALDRLSPRMRATFLLHRRDGLSLDEIAARLGISRAMVKKYLMLGLMQLRQALEAPESQS